MDIFAHGLWSYIFFWKTKKPWKAIFWGEFPDLISWFIYFIYNILLFGFAFGKPNLNSIPSGVFTLYGIGHSLIIIAVVFGLIYLFFRKIPIYMWAWPIHVLIDIPTHARDFLPTPFLWPVSNWHFPGISWGTPWFMIVNYSAIAICLGIIIIKKRQMKKKKKL